MPSMTALVEHTKRRSLVAMIRSPSATVNVLYERVPERTVSAPCTAALMPNTAAKTAAVSIAEKFRFTIVNLLR